MLDRFKGEVLGHYLDGYGFVTVDRDPTPNSTGNGFLHLAFFCTVLSRLGLEADLHDRVYSTIAASNAKDYLGLFHRNPWKGVSELNSWDEYMSICALSKLFGLGVAKWVVSFGLEHNWCFDNQTPTHPKLASWHDRFIGLTAFYKFCAASDYPFRNRLYFLEKTALGLSVLFSCIGRNADSNMRAYIRVQALRSGGAFYQPFTKIWLWQAKRKFVTLGAMVKPYFGETHPFSSLPWID